MKTQFHKSINSWDIMQIYHFESTLGVLLNVSRNVRADPICMFESAGCFLRYICTYFILCLIPEILDFQQFCNLIGHEHTQMCLVTFNWNLWNNLLFLWTSIKSYLKYQPPTPILELLLIYHFEVLWACPAMTDQVQLICCFHGYLYR